MRAPSPTATCRIMTATAPCPIPAERSLAALTMECRAIASILAAARAHDLPRPTRLPEWNVQHLLAHMVRGVDRIRAYLMAPIPPQAEVSWLGYWSAVRQTDPVAISRRAREFAAAVNDRPVLEVWETTWQAAVEEAASCEPERHLLSPFGPMRLDHYLTTRVFEVTVHGLDLRAALELEEVATPLGLEATTRILDGLLDGPRPADLLDPVEFVLAATGRATHDDGRLPLVT